MIEAALICMSLNVYHEARDQSVQGQDLYAVWSPPHGEYGVTAGAKVGYDGTTAIKVCWVNGPMGWYDVAEVYKGEEVVAIHPIHFMEIIVTTIGEESIF